MYEREGEREAKRGCEREGEGQARLIKAARFRWPRDLRVIPEVLTLVLTLSQP